MKLFNSFALSAPFLYPLKTSKNRKVFCCFQCGRKMVHWEQMGQCTFKKGIKMNGCYKNISARNTCFNHPRIKKYTKINILERVYRF